MISAYHTCDLNNNTEMKMDRDDSIPDKVTIKSLREVADAYEKAHGQDNLINDETGFNLYRLVRGVVKYGIYSYKDALYERMFSDEVLPDPDDFE